MNYTKIIGDIKIRELQTNLGQSSWPPFMQHDEVVNMNWANLYNCFLEFQFALFDNEKFIGVGNSFPVYWDGEFSELPETGFDWAIEKAKADFDKGVKPNLLVAAQILIDPDYKSKGISYEMLQIMKQIAASNNYRAIALPVRPTLKWKYPLIPMSDYIRWENKSGEPFDPWLRVHAKMGGRIFGICEKSMDIRGTIDEWKSWTGLEFQTSGKYIVKEALVPISIDSDKQLGTYMEPNVWVIHEVN